MEQPTTVVYSQLISFYTVVCNTCYSKYRWNDYVLLKYSIIKFKRAIVFSRVFFLPENFNFLLSRAYILGYHPVNPDRIQCTSVILYSYIAQCFCIRSACFWYGVLYFCLALYCITCTLSHLQTVPHTNI